MSTRIAYTSLNQVNLSRYGLIGGKASLTRDWGKYFGLMGTVDYYRPPISSRKPDNPGDPSVYSFLDWTGNSRCDLRESERHTLRGAGRRTYGRGGHDARHLVCGRLWRRHVVSAWTASRFASRATGLPDRLRSAATRRNWATRRTEPGTHAQPSAWCTGSRTEKRSEIRDRKRVSPGVRSPKAEGQCSLAGCRRQAGNLLTASRRGRLFTF